MDKIENLIKEIGHFLDTVVAKDPTQFYKFHEKFCYFTEIVESENPTHFYSFLEKYGQKLAQLSWNEQSKSPFLHIVCECGTLEQLKACLEYNFDINAIEEFNREPIFCIQRDSPDADQKVELLLQKGAALNIEKFNSSSSLHPPLAYINALIDKQDPTFDYNALLFRKPSAEIVHALCQRAPNVDINKTDDDNYPPIYYVSNHETLKAMVDEGATIKLFDTRYIQKFNNTSLGLAQLLIDRNDPNFDCQNLLYLEQTPEVIHLLCAKLPNIDINQPDANDLPPLAYAKTHEQVKALLDEGADAYTVIPMAQPYFLSSKQYENYNKSLNPNSSFITKIRVNHLHSCATQKEPTFILNHFLLSSQISSAEKVKICQTILNHENMRDIVEDVMEYEYSLITNTLKTDTISLTDKEKLIKLFYQCGVKLEKYNDDYINYAATSAHPERHMLYYANSRKIVEFLTSHGVTPLKKDETPDFLPPLGTNYTDYLYHPDYCDVTPIERTFSSATKRALINHPINPDKEIETFAEVLTKEELKERLCQLPQDLVFVGSEKADRDKINPIINHENPMRFNKPKGGLWTSPMNKETQKTAWQDFWYEDEFYSKETQIQSHIIPYKDSKIFIPADDLSNLMPYCHLEKRYNWVIDFEKIKEDYDAAYFPRHVNNDRYDGLYRKIIQCYDVTSVIFLNKDKITILDNKEYQEYQEKLAKIRKKHRLVKKKDILKKVRKANTKLAHKSSRSSPEEASQETLETTISTTKNEPKNITTCSVVSIKNTNEL